jgi:uncharacterized protein (DUF433 family)
MVVVVDDQLIAMPRDRAARLAGVTVRRVDYWARTALVEPSVSRRISPRNHVRLYGFGDLLELLTVASLVDRPGISLQHVRRTVAFLREVGGFERPLRQLVFATLGAELYFQYPDGSWSGDAQPDQLVLREVIELDVLRHRIRAAAGREEATVGQIARRRGVVGSKPVVAGTRVPVDTVRRYIDHGFTDEYILSSFPVLQAADIAAVRHATA